MTTLATDRTHANGHHPRGLARPGDVPPARATDDGSASSPPPALRAPRALPTPQDQEPASASSRGPAGHADVATGQPATRAQPVESAPDPLTPQRGPRNPQPAEHQPDSPPASPPFRLPDHVDRDLLLFRYFEGANLLDLANELDVSLEDLVAWSETPSAQRQLDRLRACDQRRIEHMQARSAVAGVAAIYQMLSRPLHNVTHCSIPDELRSQEQTLKAALAILGAIERAKEHKRKLSLRRAIAALNPRRRAVPPTTALRGRCSSSAPADSAPPNLKQRLTALRIPSLFRVPPVPRVPPAPPAAALHARRWASQTPAAQRETRPEAAAPSVPATTRPTGPESHPADNAPPTPAPTAPSTPPIKSIPSIRSIKSIKSIPAQLRISAPCKPRAKTLLDQSGALPRAP